MQSTRGDFGSFETELEQWVLQCTPGLLEVLGSEGQDIRRYPGARSFS